MSTEFDAIMGFNYLDDGDEAVRLAKYLGEEEFAFRNETRHEMPFVDAVKIFENHGFRIVYEETYVDDLSEDSNEETFKILWRDGILLTCESYNKKLESASMYYNWVAHEAETSMFDFLSSGVYSSVSDFL